MLYFSIDPFALTELTNILRSQTYGPAERSVRTQYRLFSSISSERVLGFVMSLISTAQFCSFVGPSACFSLRIAYVCVHSFITLDRKSGLYTYIESLFSQEWLQVKMGPFFS